ncbi:hypothetical protein GALL_410270 [mine drainage metagenome]|uniref:DUF4446 domain-containing protein n=1 Tax=mine drainage metagenome TaxID=410659 RepID=A0A1J5QMN9_9ZZZZ
MNFSQHAANTLALVGVIVGSLSLVAAFVLFLRFARLRRRYTLLQGDGQTEDFIGAVAKQVEVVDALRKEVDGLRIRLDQTRTELADALRHVSVIRYDAFGDMGGRMSFSAALLDDSGDGVVFTSINARSEARTYIRGIKAGVSPNSSLSAEEEQAVQRAMQAASS